MPRPVRHAAARRVARSDREVGAPLDRGEQAGEVGGVVREVGVDLDHDVEAAGDADRVAGAVRAAEPELAGPAQHLDPAELGAERFGLLGGAVGAVVVDDEDVGVGHRLADTAHEQLDVLGFLVGRDGDPHALAVDAPSACS